MRLSVLLAVTWRDDTPRLSLPVREISLVVDNDVAGLSGSLWSDNTLGRHDLTSEWRLVLVNVDRNGRLVPVRAGLQKVLLLLPTEQLQTDDSSSDTGTDSNNLFGVISSLDNFGNLLGSVGSWRESRSRDGNGSKSTSGSLGSLHITKRSPEL
jgi:hypothetical protein